MYRIRPETLFEVHRSGADRRGEPTSGAKIVIGNVETDTGERGRASLTTDAARADIARNSTVSIDTDATRTGVPPTAADATLSTSAGQSVVLGERERAEATKERGTIGEKQRLPETAGLFSSRRTNAVFELGRKDDPSPLVRVKEASRLPGAGRDGAGSSSRIRSNRSKRLPEDDDDGPART